MESEGKRTASTPHPVPRPRRPWLWFGGGFLLVFVGMLLFVSMIELHPSGRYAVRYPLWQYYAVGLPRLFGPIAVGPASGGGSALVQTGLQHLLLSAVGGGVAGAVGWWVDRLRGHTAAELDK